MLEQRLKLLICDFDYVYSKNVLSTRTIRGFTTAKKLGTFKNVIEAARYLIPVIDNVLYTNRFNEIINDNYERKK
jgi:hypothetical protein